MAQTFIAAHVAAGNASDAVLFTMPAGSNGYLNNIIAYNSTGGALTLTLKITETNGDVVVIAVTSIAAGATQSYSGNSTVTLTPQTLLTGNIITARGSGAGITVRCSGLSFT